MQEDHFFLRAAKDYTRKLDPIKDYIEEASRYLVIKTGCSTEFAKSKIKEILIQNPTGRIKNPVVKYLERGSNGDRTSQQITLSGYIRSVVQNEEVLAPTFTSYINPKQKVSIAAEFTQINAKTRSVAKKAALAAQAIGDMVTYEAKNNQQGIMKIYNNSLSGAYGSSGTSLINLTGHSTLTSTTRTISSLGNAVNERMISGNRHYRNYPVVINSIISTINQVDLNAFEAVMQKYRLYYPTAQDALACVEYSTRFYWINQFYLLKILDLLEKLSPIELAAFVYIGDLYHLKKHNPDLIKTFLTELKEKVILPEQTESKDCLALIKKADDDILNFACQIASEEVKGLGKSYSEMPLKVQQTLAGTAQHIQKTLEHYRSFIQEMFANFALPCSVAYLPSMVRRAVVLSDTDSTMFSTDEYVQWYYGSMVFSQEAFALAAAVMFLSTQSIAHSLRILSANIGVSTDNIGVLTMKPEFSFPVFVQTPVAKHYFASVSVQEGNVFKKPKYEIKGVHLKSSAAPPAITAQSKSMMEKILDDVGDNKKISLMTIIKEAADLERFITASIDKGEVMYFRTAKIKQLEAYAGQLSITPYFHQMLWEEVFQEKYGHVEPIPNTAIKIPLDLPNKTACAYWIDHIQDKELAARLRASLIKYKKETLGTILINKIYCISQGIPPEIRPVIDKKKIILELTKSFRLIIDSLGYCIKKDLLLMELGY